MAQSSSSKSVDPEGPRKVEIIQGVINTLREQSLAGDDGVFLGAEEDMLARFRVSRPTFRQIARVLEHEQLLTVRRGKGGGYFSRRPTMQAVQRASANYLRARGTSHTERNIAGHALFEALIPLAARSDDDATRRELRRHCRLMAGRAAASLTAAQYVADDTRAVEILARLANNAPLELFVLTLYRMGLDVARWDVLRGRPERVRRLHHLRVEFLKALIDRDTEIAAVQFRRWGQQIAAWGLEDRAATAGVVGT